MKKRYVTFFLLILLALTRIIDLNWGFPFLMHPDERNMVFAALKLYCSSLLSIKDCFNPNFYAYGQLPLYLTKLLNPILNLVTDYSQILNYALGLRLISAFCSLISGILIYKIIRKQTNIFLANSILLIYIFMPVFSQFAHFGTTESILTLSVLGLIYFEKKYFFQAVLLGFAIGIKASAVILLAIPIFQTLDLLKYKTKKILQFAKKNAWLILILLLTLGITSPHNIINLNQFLETFSYESSVAMGQIKVFYTQQFVYTRPIIFQVLKIFPYTIGIPLFITSFFGFIVLIKNRKLCLPFSFILILIFSTFMYVKWVRFMVFVYPFFLILSTQFLYYVFKKNKCLSKVITLGLVLFQLIIGSLFLFNYFKTDVRISASIWMNENLPKKAKIITESRNSIALPLFNRNQFQVKIIDLYDLDLNPKQANQTIKLLKTVDYVIVPSRRVFMNYTCQHMPDQTSFIELKNCTDLSNKFPYINKYYEILLSPENFKLIKIFSSALRIEEYAEETWTVFDRPTIRIFKRINY